MAAGADAVADDGFVVVVSIGSVAIFCLSNSVYVRWWIGD